MPDLSVLGRKPRCSNGTVKLRLRNRALLSRHEMTNAYRSKGPLPLHRMLRAGPDRKRTFVKPFECGEIGPDLFRKTCEFGFEGLVSKHPTGPIVVAHRSIELRIKNRKHPAMSRVIESFR